MVFYVDNLSENLAEKNLILSFTFPEKSIFQNLHSQLCI